MLCASLLCSIQQPEIGHNGSIYTNGNGQTPYKSTLLWDLVVPEGFSRLILNHAVEHEAFEFLKKYYIVKYISEILHYRNVPRHS